MREIKERAMKRFLMAVAIAGMVLGCGDDDDTTPAGDGGADAGRDGGMDASTDSGAGDGGTDAAVSARVNSVLAACSSANVATACGGTTPICATGLAFVGGVYPGTGACTAECTKGDQCGTGGVCPVGEAIAAAGGFPVNDAGLTLGQSLGGKGYCSKGCTVGTNTCGTGLACVSIRVLAAQQGGSGTPEGAPWTTGFCIPLPAAPSDAGTGDGGVADAGGMDSGT